MLTTDSRDDKEKDLSGKEEKKNKEQGSSSEENFGEELSNSENAQNLDIKNLHTQPVHMNTITRLSPDQCEKLVRYVFSYLLFFFVYAYGLNFNHVYRLKSLIHI